MISTVNPLPTAPATARMFVDFTAMGEQTGKFLADTSMASRQMS